MTYKTLGDYLKPHNSSDLDAIRSQLESLPRFEGWIDREKLYYQVNGFINFHAVSAETKSRAKGTNQ